MQELPYFQGDLSVLALDPNDGELLAGSGFETEEPEREFVAAELDWEE